MTRKKTRRENSNVFTVVASGRWVLSHFSPHFLMDFKTYII